MEKKIPVIIDCDPGIDDAVALVTAFAQPALDILAVTTVAGNVSIEKVTAGARAVLGVLGVKSKIYKGARGPLMGADVIEAPEAHGVSGLGNFSIGKEHWHPLEQMSALEAQKQILTESKEPVTIIAVGPLTNIAILIKAYPELICKIEKISLMGGGLYTGNHTAAGEFNILADPESAQIVYQSGIPIIMAGLDVTHQAKIYGSDLAEIKAIGTPVSDMVYKAIEFNFEKYSKEEKDKQYVRMHDSCSVLVLIYPEMFKGKDLNVMVETSGRFSRGYTLADLRGNEACENTNCHVLLEIDREMFYKEIIKSIKHFS